MLAADWTLAAIRLGVEIRAVWTADGVGSGGVGAVDGFGGSGAFITPILKLSYGCSLGSPGLGREVLLCAEYRPLLQGRKDPVFNPLVANLDKGSRTQLANVKEPPNQKLNRCGSEPVIVRAGGGTTSLIDTGQTHLVFGRRRS